MKVLTMPSTASKLLAALALLSVASVAAAKDRLVHFGTTAATPNSEQETIRVVRKNERRQKAPSAWNPQRRYYQAMIQQVSSTQSGQSEHIVMFGASSLEARVIPGLYVVDVVCRSSVFSFGYSMQIDVEANSQYVVECMGVSTRNVKPEVTKTTLPAEPI
jgi:hypothetical protein